ncbi:MAG: RIP metalloprotease RseP [Prevotellaceae bacterium]|jgi:regulator of sigma E protease|nr:RIP metalloprotease RseP [Prevotellaceae bacterium]
MEAFLIKALQLILALSILVFVHELGHFGFARLFKVRVDKFYLFFNPKFSILRLKKINGKWLIKLFAKNPDDHLQNVLDSEGLPKLDRKGKPVKVPVPIEQLPEDDWRRYPKTTEWGIGWLPLGGYCKIAGMVDETTEILQLSSEPQPWEYRSRPVWQRMLMICGGVIFNFIAAILIFAMILFKNGEEFIPLENEYLGYNYCQTALKYGFENGDRIVSINNEKINTKKEVIDLLIIEGKQDVTVSRYGQAISFQVPKDFGEKMVEAKEKQFMTERIPFVVDSIVKDPLVYNVRLVKGDSVVGLNGKHLFEFKDISNELLLCKNKKVDISFYRNGNFITDSIVVDENGKMGIILKNPVVFFKTQKTEYGFFASFPAGWRLGVETLSTYIKQFRLVFTKAGAQSVGGFGAIGSLFPGTWDWTAFWSMTAFISIILAFMNILPIPVLDGGYLLFLIYELITRKKPSDKFMEISLNIGMFLMLALLVYANGNDILKLF